MNEGLERRVAERTAQLSQSTAALEAANRELMDEIAERRLAEEALRTSERSYRTLAQNLPAIVYRIFVRENNRMEFLNDMAQAMTGYLPGELKAGAVCSIDPLILAEDRAEIVRIVKQAFIENHPFQVTYRIVHKDGGVRYFSERGRPICGEDGEPALIEGIIFDVTESKHMEEDLRHAHDNLRAEAARLELRVEERTAQLSVANGALQEHGERLQILHEIDHAILGARSTADIAQVAVQHVRRTVPCYRADVVLFDWAGGQVQWLAVDASGETKLGPGVCMPLEAYQVFGAHPEGGTGQLDALVIQAGQQSSEHVLLLEGLRHYLSIPLVAGHRPLGNLGLWRDVPEEFSQEQIGSAHQIADSLAVAIDNARLDEQVRLNSERLRGLSRRLVEAQESERRALARELHDQAGQSVTALALHLGLLETESAGSAVAGARVQELKQIASGLAEELHRLAIGLHPAVLDHLSLVPALRQYVESFGRQSGLQVQFLAMDLESQRLLPEVELTLYRVVQEGLTNIQRHARATRADVILERRAHTVAAIIEDDGVGFDAGEVPPTGHLGLFGMQERIEALGGRLTIESSPGAGTALFVEVPYPGQK